MEAKLYNKEVIEIAKELFVRNFSVTQTISNEELSDVCIDAAESLIVRLTERNCYADNSVDEDEDKRIQFELNRDVRETGLRVRTLNCVRAYINSRSTTDNSNCTIADIIRYGRRNITMCRNAGRQTLADIDQYLQSHGLSWDIDIDKYK